MALVAKQFVIRGPPSATMLFSYLDDNLTIGSQVTNLFIIRFHSQEAEEAVTHIRTSLKLGSRSDTLSVNMSLKSIKDLEKSVFADTRDTALDSIIGYTETGGGPGATGVETAAVGNGRKRQDLVMK